MTATLARRHVLMALAALAAGAGTPAGAAAPGIDPEGAKLIGRAYLAEHPGLDAKAVQAELLPGDWTPAARTRLRARAAADFRAGRLWLHRGWRLSETEGRLFALAAVGGQGKVERASVSF